MNSISKRYYNSNCYTAAQIAEGLLIYFGLYNIKVIRWDGKDSNRFFSKNATIALNSDIYSSTSIEAIEIVCHEVGHSVQCSKDSFLFKMRNIVKHVSWELLLLGGIVFALGCFLSFLPAIKIGAFVVLLDVFGWLITLPVEFGANKIAIKALTESGLCSQF